MPHVPSQSDSDSSSSRNEESAGQDSTTLVTRHAEFCRRARSLEQVANVLLEYYHCEGPVHLLEGITQLYQAHYNLVVVSCPKDMPIAMAHLGDVLFTHYRLHDDLTSLTSSIVRYQRALNNLEPASSLYCVIAPALAYALLFRYETLSSEEDCRAAVQTLDAASWHTRDNPMEQAWILTVMGLIKARKSTLPVLKPTRKDLEDILVNLRKTPRILLPQSQYIHSLLAEVYLSRQLFQKTRAQEQLDDGFRAARLASRLCSEHAEVMKVTTDFALFTMHHAAFLHHRGKDGWDVHIEAAFSIIYDLLKTALPTRNNDIHHRLLHASAMVSLEKCEHLGDLDGMENALESMKKAVYLCPQMHVSRPMLINNLVYGLHTYFFQSGRVSALDEISRLQDDLAPDYISHIPLLAVNFAETMLLRAQIADVQSARLLIRQAIHLCQSRKEVLERAVNTISHMHELEYTSANLRMITASQIQARMGDPSFLDSETLIQLARRCNIKPDVIEPSEQMGLVLAQTDALTSQALIHQDSSYLNSAEAILEEVKTMKSIDSSIFRVDLLAARADLLVARSDLLGRDDHLLNSAWKTYQLAATATSARSQKRLQACLRWATNATDRGNPGSAYDAYSCAIDILPSLIFMGEDVLGRIEALRQVSGLAGSAFAGALAIGNIHAAIDFLERTRGILWLQASQAREAKLKSLPATVRDHFVTTIRELEDADRLQWTIRRQRAEELAKVTSEIRALPGFERFLLPPLLHELECTLCDSGGYAVVISAGDSFFDVVVLGGHERRSHLRLAALKMDRLRAMSQGFSAACLTTREAARKTDNFRKIQSIIVESSKPNDPVTTLLSELWTSLVLPIIQHMGIEKNSNRQSRKRLWWCPIGPLGALPFHAAGFYDAETQDYLGQYFISSYVPNLTALYRLLTERISSSTLHERSPRVLLVAQTDTTNGPSLPKAQVEVNCVRALLSPETVITTPYDHNMSVEAALHYAKDAHVIHLACHGYQDQEDPLRSGFELQNGRLTLGQLMRINTPNAQLAYLSACESAGMDKSRPDEGLNLVGTMIFVGFKSVIGTMWAMDDIDGPFMAARIYTRIFRDGILDLSAVPSAVDDAVRELRESGVPASRWATYVHFGV